MAVPSPVDNAGDQITVPVLPVAGSTPSPPPTPPVAREAFLHDRIPVDPSLRPPVDPLGLRGGIPAPQVAALAPMDGIFARDRLAGEVESLGRSESDSGDDLSLHSSEDELSADELEAKHEKRRNTIESERRRKKGKGMKGPLSIRQLQEQKLGAQRRAHEKEVRETWRAYWRPASAASCSRP